MYEVDYTVNYVTNGFDVASNTVSTILICVAENIGCTNTNACNYNSEANIDDDSCTYAETYYNCDGTCINDIDGDGICDELEILGCTDPSALNYNSNATDDDGICIYDSEDSICQQDQWFLPFEGITGTNMTLLLQESFVSSMNTQTNNAYLVAASESGLLVGSTNVNNAQTSMAIWGDDSFTTEIDGATDGQLINFYLIDGNQLFDINYSTNYITNDVDVFIDAVVPVLICTAENLGCTDDASCNYDASATIEDGSCINPETYYNCDGTCINDIDGDGVCNELEILGCTDSFAFNFNINATDNDGSCIYVIYGCTNTNACNYYPDATNDDGSCVFAQMYYDCDGNCINDTDQDLICDEEDNCIEVVNPVQADLDNDGEGDACDYDDGIGIDEISEDIPILIRMIDILGREQKVHKKGSILFYICLLYTSPSPRDATLSRMPSSA